MDRYRNLMVAVSGTDKDTGLIRYAAEIARLLGAAEVHFVHVLAAEPPSDKHDCVAARLQELVQTSFGEAPPATRLSFSVVAGPLIDRLLACVAENHIDLLLVDSQTGLSGRRSLARRLAMKAPCSVWIVPQGTAPSFRRILVPIDFSGPAADAIRVATVLTRLAGQTECLALHVYFDEAVTTYDGYDQVLRGQEEQAFRKFISPINCQGVKIKFLCEESNNVAHTVGRVAENNQVDLIMMATRGRSRSAAILLGSVAEDTIIETRLPLLAVKHFGARMSVLQALLDRRFHHGRGLHTD